MEIYFHWITEEFTYKVPFQFQILYIILYSWLLRKMTDIWVGKCLNTYKVIREIIRMKVLEYVLFWSIFEIKSSQPEDRNDKTDVVQPISDGLFPEVAQVPYSFILELGAKQRVGLGQDGYQPEQVAADCSEDEAGHYYPPVRSFGHQERGHDAHQPPQGGEADHRQG